MLETIHEYAREKLEESGEAEALQQAHARYFMGLAERAEPLLTGKDQVEWLNRLEDEHDDLRAALAWTSTPGVDPVLGLRLAGSLVWFWYFRGYLSEAQSGLEAAIEHARVAEDSPLPPGTSGGERMAELPRLRAWAKVLSAAGAIAFLRDDYPAARAHLERSLAIWRELGDKRGTAFALTFLGRTSERLGDPAGRAMGEESAALFREVGEKWGLALALDFLGLLATDRGEQEQAGALHRESLALYRELGHRWGVALQLSSFGQAALSQGDYPTAREHLEEAVAIEREVGDKWLLAVTLNRLADVQRQQGDHEKAEATNAESVAIFRELGQE